jgi:two-component system chemotaxis response regulator CheY
MAQIILVVDDSQTVRHIMSGALKSNGYEVIQAVDGVDALLQLEGLTSEPAVDLVLTDINMPNMGGLELITKLKANPRYASIPVITLTSEAEKEMKEKGKVAGAFAWIVKPSTPENVNKVVQLTLKRHAK